MSFVRVITALALIAIWVVLIIWGLITWWAISQPPSPTVKEVCDQMKQFNSPTALAEWVGGQSTDLLGEVIACTYFRKGLSDWLDERSPVGHTSEWVRQP